ncbi:MAG: redoxin domain-containing protein [Opitutaceae bacterium]
MKSASNLSVPASRMILPFALLGLVAALVPARAQLYRVGDTVSNFTLTDRATGLPVSLYSLEGKVIFLEWFAHWCPFCQAAASQIGPQVVDYFEQRGGNVDGVELVHVSLNLQAGQESQTQAFINQYKLGAVWNDFNRVVANRFGSAQPIFAIINGLTDSPSHRPWELVYVRNGYGSLNSPIQTFRNAINAVAAAEVVPDSPPRITTPPASVGAVAGSPVVFEATAEGENLLYQWSRDGVDLPGKTEPTLNLGGVSEADAGIYRVRVGNGGGSVTSQSAFLSLIAPGAAPAQLANVSTRLNVGTGGRILIAGFYIEGTQPGRVLIRGIGPSLAGFNLDGVLADPVLRLFQGNAEVAVNDDWGSLADAASVRMEWQVAGAFDLESGTRDGVLLEELPTGLYTAQIRGSADTTGLGLVEVYDVAGSGGGVLTNISTRGRIVGNSARMIMGFVLRGEAPRTVLIRGIGPTLSEFNVQGAVTDPRLRLFSSPDNTLLAENEVWADTQATAIVNAAAEVAAFPLAADSRDTAILITLPPGGYTAHVSADNDEEGVVLAEVYVLPE